jgi:hypothetical protein
VPIVLPAFLRCDGACGAVTAAEVVMNNKSDLELRCEEAWTVEQVDATSKAQVWCPRCKEARL